MEGITVSRKNLDSKTRRAKKLPFVAPASSTLFPPTIYSNVVYSHGICLSCDGSNMSVPSDYMVAAYGNVTFPYSPLLSQPDIWSHKYSAEEASKQGFPLPIYRRLGTITRTIVADGPPPEIDPIPDLNSECRHVPKRQRITPAQAKRQALLDIPEGYTETELQQKVKEIQLAWDSHWKPDPIPKLWDQEYGHLHPLMVNDPSYVPLQHLVCWEHNPSQEVLNLYHGIRTVRIDTHSLFKALAELQSPRGLYHTPLILTYPRLTNVGARTYLLQIGVYCHRLAAEVLYEKDLLTIMSALDSDSYITIEPIHIPPIPPQPTFASAPLPELVYHEVDMDTPPVTEPNSSSHPIDLTLGESSREVSDVLSAFSIPGLLKIWENTGNDISEWPLLEPELSRGLTMPLLCHQIHALCWMRQMEKLGGLGLNSILWEERQWEDGGKYYYSPALGQLRLARPATMHGGILADEMGLG
jgi:SNF2-related domain